MAAVETLVEHYAANKVSPGGGIVVGARIPRYTAVFNDGDSTQKRWTDERPDWKERRNDRRPAGSLQT